MCKICEIEIEVMYTKRLLIIKKMSFVVQTTKVKHSINKLQKSIKAIFTLTKFFYNHWNINSIMVNSK